MSDPIGIVDCCSDVDGKMEGAMTSLPLVTGVAAAAAVGGRLLFVHNGIGND